ncbi:SAF domain-containing protein [Amycolatopsis roodepoortensis]|uniref:Flp pilus assembly protein CpaB n=1 Tax=Amycolatopsis roodepoortensis TaxID=700274 RepID=A0ABR9L6K2_9PSEU|nr:SAF domain-containing protein [Amycolatopsis roodepoortensis]MBE1576338.1 Flp pilus assembly protein CpaB [Amycolatopsis roodepoortensis]
MFHQLPVLRRLQGRPARLLRRWLALSLLLGGLIALFLPASARGTPGTATVVSARDLPAGSLLRAEDVKLVDLPDDVRPQGATGLPSSVEGRMLVGAARSGEPLTDVRLLDAGIPGSGDPESSTVPVRLADAGVAELLRPGRRVDVVAAAEAGREASVLASAAVVAAVGEQSTRDPTSPRAGSKGPLVLLSLPSAIATRVAATSLERSITVTLR